MSPEMLTLVAAVLTYERAVESEECRDGLVGWERSLESLSRKPISETRWEKDIFGQAKSVRDQLIQLGKSFEIS